MVENCDFDMDHQITVCELDISELPKDQWENIGPPRSTLFVIPQNFQNLNHAVSWNI